VAAAMDKAASWVREAGEIIMSKADREVEWKVFRGISETFQRFFSV